MPRRRPLISPDEFKAARAKMGLTQEQFARKFPLSRHSLIRYELGRNSPRPITVHRFRALVKEYDEKHAKPNGGGISTSTVPTSPSAPSEAPSTAAEAHASGPLRRRMF